MATHADGFGLIQDIDVQLTVELGRKSMRLRDVLALGESSVVELDRLTDEPLDMFV
ncbi:MAG TPA: flagellar motor switch protein FliN, partial [Erythrobacter sp.]|nr:flagellar motor switch protein FliN [Erythrobacter sp.]